MLSAVVSSMSDIDASAFAEEEAHGFEPAAFGCGHQN